MQESIITESSLHHWVQEQNVCFELLAHFALEQGAKRQVGFELHLYARHNERGDIHPGCRKCRDLYRKLREVILLVLPREERWSRYEISPFDSAFHLRPETRMKAEVQLTLLIVHRENYFRDVDECEKRCASEIVAKLKELGAKPKAGCFR